MRCNRTPSNPNNYIWGTYIRPQTPEDKLISNLMGAALIGSLFGAFGLFRWLFSGRRRPAIQQQHDDGDLFKNW